MQPLSFLAAATFEIGGCYLIWLAQRTGAPWLWLPALVALGLFGWMLTLTGSDSAGRAFAAYGGIYIAASVLFMATIEQVRPDRWDLIGAAICIIGAGIIFLGPRGA